MREETKQKIMEILEREKRQVRNGSFVSLEKREEDLEEIDVLIEELSGLSTNKDEK